MLDFVEDPAKATFGGSSGMIDNTTIIHLQTMLAGIGWIGGISVLATLHRIFSRTSGIVHCTWMRHRDA